MPFRSSKKRAPLPQGKPRIDESLHPQDDAAELRKQGEALARETMDRLFLDSTLQDLSKMLPAFDRDEIQLGTLLGMGSFGVVFEVRGVKLDAEKQAEDSLLPQERAFLSDHISRDNGDARYAVKKLTQQAISDPIKGRYTQAVLDMAIETRLLSNLDDHPHICKLRGVAASRDPFSPTYLLILDRLYDTLSHRIYQVWKPRWSRYRSMSTKWLVDSNGLKMRQLRQEQLLAGVQICAALDHLHSRRILFRDLKPDNCGYDVRDDIKIFDFGLAKELRRELRVDDDSGMYKLTALTGSPRYMAPEVANGVPYNETADAYSFAIMFYEMYSMSCPFETFTMEQMHDKVWGSGSAGKNGAKGKRPFRPSKWPEAIRDLLKRGWTADHHNRMTVVEMMEALHVEHGKLESGASLQGDGGVFAVPTPVTSLTSAAPKKALDRKDLRAAFRKRKSTFVFRGNAESLCSSLSAQEVGDDAGCDNVYTMDDDDDQLKLVASSTPTTFHDSGEIVVNPAVSTKSLSHDHDDLEELHDMLAYGSDDESVEVERAVVVSQ